MSTLESRLKQLPEPEQPEALAAGVAARIARLDDQDAAGGAGRNAAVEESGRERLSWSVGLVGMAIGLGAQCYMLLSGDLPLDLTSLRLSRDWRGAPDIVGASPAIAVLAVGLLLYFVGFVRSVQADEGRG